MSPEGTDGLFVSILSDPGRIVTDMAPDKIEIVRLAAAHYRYEAHRHERAREQFGLTPTHFYQLVNQLLEDPDVAIAEPVIVARLRRQRDRRYRLKRAG